MFTNTKAQLYVSALNVGHFQVLQVVPTCVESLQFVGWGGCEISFCVGEKGVTWGCLGNCVEVTSMSTYSYV